MYRSTTTPSAAAEVVGDGQQLVATVRRRPTPADENPLGYRKRTRRIELGLGIAVPVMLFVVWQIASVNGFMDRRFFPAPTDIWATGYTMVVEGQLNDHAIASIRRTLFGFLLGCTTGVAAGVALSMSRLARAALEPLLYGLWTVPKLALLPMLLLIFGLNERPIIILIGINCFFLCCIPTLASMLTVSFPYREAATSFGATRWQMLRHVTFPAALPQIFVALRLCAGASILVLVAVEFVSSQKGMGFIIWNSWSLFLADRMYVGIVLVATVGALFTMTIGAVGHWLSPWAKEG